MTIDPKTTMVINIIVALLAAIVGGTISLSGIVSAEDAQIITKWSAFALSIYGVVNAAMSAVASNKPGPLANKSLKFWK